MSTETNNQLSVDVVDKVKKDQLQSKYNKFKVFGHWIIGRIAEKLNNLDQEKKNGLNLYEFMMDQHCLYSSVEDQTAYYELFLEENPKFSLKAINKEVRKHNKPIKVKKEKDPDVPKKKRGRKKKIVEDNTTEEEKYIANIVALQKDDIDEPILQLQSPQVYENSSPREIEENTKKKSKVIDEKKPKRKYTKKTKDPSTTTKDPSIKDPSTKDPSTKDPSINHHSLKEDVILEDSIDLQDDVIIANSFQSLHDAANELIELDEFIPFEYKGQDLLINKSLQVFDKTASKHIASLQNNNLVFY